MRPSGNSIFAFALLPLLAVVACSSSSRDHQQAADEIEAIPFASTKMLLPNDLSSLSPDLEDGQLVFNKAPAILDGVTTGNVIVAGISPSTPHGFMRVVVDAQRAGDTLTLQTAVAPPQLAFRKLHARVARSASLNDGDMQMHAEISPLDLAHANGSTDRIAPIDVILFDGDGDTTTTDDQLRIEGSVSGGLTYDLSLDVDWGDVTDLPSAVSQCVASVAKIVTGKKPSCALADLLPEIKVTFTVDPRVTSELRTAGQASLAFEKDFDIATINLTPIVLGPVVFLPTLDVIAKVEGSASASFRAGVNGHMELTSSVAISSKMAGNPAISEPKIKDKGFTIDEPEVGLHAQVQANVGVRLAMPLYGMLGPYATAEATLSLVADPSQSPCWELRAGLESTIGVRITTPTLPLLGHVDLVNWSAAPFKAIDEVVGSGECKDPPAGTTHLAPGSGPDAPALRDPSFVPWSNMDDGSADGSSATTPSSTGIVFSDLNRAIDGRWLIAGSESRALLKMDDQGHTIWRAQYFTANDDMLSIRRTVPTRDASIAAIASGANGSSFEFMEVGQAGGVKLSQSYALPSDACATPSARLLMNDGANGAGTGFIVAGECESQGKAFVVHLDETGDVQSARIWSDPSTTGLTPTAFTRSSNGDLVLVGEAHGDDGDGMFVARLDDEGESFTSINRYMACDSAFNISPTAVLAAESNGITVSGGSHAQSRAFVTRIQENGDIGFVTYPGLVNGSSPIFVASAIAELPTSGFVVAASTTELTADGAANIPAIALVGLDASGRAMWSKRYALANNHASSFGALRLTTDGGALVSAIADSGSTWTMKAFAKDGSLSDPNVIASALVTDDGPATTCALRSVPFAPVANDVAITSASLTLTRR